ncbi:hypothetical protein RP20_CCG011553 [Aedes albopictus]|nr:hypothetical protein RP20_CCG011553 [Aedes albopictus]
MLKITLLIASLAYASAGYAGFEPSYGAHYPSAPAVGYNTFAHSHSLGHGFGYAHAAPVLAAPVHTYSAPLTKAYSHGYNYAPSLAHGHGYGYAPALSHNSYGHSAYAAPLHANTLAVAQPQLYHQNTYATHAAAPLLTTHGYNHGASHLLGYNNHHGGHHAY